MGKIVDIYKYAVDGDCAERVYEILKTSYFVENGCQPFEGFCLEVKLDYADGVLYVDEKVTGGRAAISFMAEILYFFADRDNIFSMSEHMVDDVARSYYVDDSEGKYFVRPPKTEWELQQEELQRQRTERRTDDDLPF